MMQFAMGFPSVVGGYFGAHSERKRAEAPTGPEGFHPIDPDLYTREFIAEFASVAGESGFTAIHFTEHPIPSTRWLENGGHEAVDPIVALAFLAGLDADIRLLTQLTVLPYRNPFLYAKAAATLDRLSNGRVILGVGTGYLKSEFHALGVGFDERNDLFDESLAVCRLAWTGEPFSYEGRHFSAQNVRSLPTPIQETIPIWIGGNSKIARRRVAESAQGWLPQPNPRDVAATRRTAVLETLNDLERMLTDLREQVAAVGRTDPIDVMFTSHEGGIPGSRDWDSGRRVADLRAQAALGVTWHHTNPIGSTPKEVLDMVRAYGDDVISPLR